MLRKQLALVVLALLLAVSGCGGEDSGDGFSDSGVKVETTEGTNVTFDGSSGSSSTSTTAAVTSSSVLIETDDGGFPDAFPVPAADSISLSGTSTTSQTLTVTGETMESVREWLLAGLRQRGWFVDLDTEDRIEFSGAGAAGAAVFAENGDGDVDLQIVLAAR